MGVFDRDQRKILLNNLRDSEKMRGAVACAFKIAYRQKFSELICDDREDRALFALALAYHWIASRIEYGWRLPTIERTGIGNYDSGLVSALSALIGQPYELCFDPVALLEQIHCLSSTEFESPVATHPPVNYEDQFQVWPELSHLQNAPYVARKALVLITLQIARPAFGFTSFRTMPLGSLLQPGVVWLIHNGLLNATPSASELLASLPTNKLKTFAEQYGIEVRRTHIALRNAILAEIDEETIASFLHRSLDLEWPVRPRIANLEALKKFLQDQCVRLRVYLEWIGAIEYGEPNQMYVVLRSERRPGDYHLDLPTSPNDRQIDINLVHREAVHGYLTHDQQAILPKFWDEQCEAILANAIG